MVEPRAMREVDVKEVPSLQCRQKMQLERETCAGDQKSTCQGDLGGPRMTRMNGKVYHTGIVSFGINCCSTRQVSPLVFEKRSFYLNWIKQKTQGAQHCTGLGKESSARITSNN